MVYSPVSCSGFEAALGETVVFIGTYGAGNSALFFMGYDANNFFWHDARIWGRIAHFTNGSPSKPGFTSRIRLMGAVFKETCTGDRVPEDRTRQLRHKNFKFRHDYPFDLRLRSDDDMFATFSLFGTSGTVPDLTFSKGFSTL